MKRILLTLTILNLALCAYNQGTIPFLSQDKTWGIVYTLYNFIGPDFSEETSTDFYKINGDTTWTAE
jgi:hypothetical protein